MPLSSVHLLPLAVFVMLPGTFLVTYIIAVLLGHVEIYFPYISDTGTHTPESCIFSQCLNIVSFLVALTVYVRYKQIEQYYRDHLSPESSKILSRNLIALWLGWVSAFGLSVVANFQETNVFRVHMIGAMTCFTFGLLFAWLQTIMSFQMIGVVNTVHVARIRMFLSTIMTFSYATSMICGPRAFKEFHGKDPTNWHYDDGGWTLHVISTVAEWISALSLDFFILTFVREMHLISLSSPRVMFVIDSIQANYESDHIEVLRSSVRGTADDVQVSMGRSLSVPASQVIIH
ncbi:DNA damage-regulated autophagy modulator protein 2 [Halotydeus destructor]|nr:DNA damage-regulated autophagy modulator protein 2 [Halotydeus destructor]